MATITLNGSASGSVNLTVPAAAGTNTITFPAASGTVALVGGAATSLTINGTGSGTLTLVSQSAASGTLTFPNGNGNVLASAANLTAGSVLFAGASNVVSQDNANLFWNDTNNRLGIGTATPAQALDVVGTIKNSTGVLFSSGTNQTDAAIGYGQTVQTVTGSRAFSTTYTNTTGKTIVAYVNGISSVVGGFNILGYVDGVLFSGATSYSVTSGQFSVYVTLVIPNGSTYSVTPSSATLNVWAELR